MANISCCLIVKNEEKNLSNCLESIKNLVNEIIIVDTGSTDNTVKIAEKFDAKIYYNKWDNNFAIARNEALKYVNSEWVLVLDADEILEQNIIPEIQKLITQKDNLVINLLRHEIGSNSSPYSLVSRLFRHHPKIQFSRPYHALIDDHVTELLKVESHWQIISLPKIAIKHYGYQPEIIISKNKTFQAKKAMETYFNSHPNDTYVSSKLGALYIDIGETKKGIQLLRKALKSNLAKPPVLFELHFHLANILTKKKDFNEAIKHYQKAVNQPILEQLKLGAYNNFASLYQVLKDYEKAINLYQKVITIDPNFAIVYYNLGLTYKANGQILEAIKNYEIAIKLNPEYAWSYQNLGLLLFQYGQFEDSYPMLRNALILHRKYEPSQAIKLQQELAIFGINLN